MATENSSSVPGSASRSSSAADSYIGSLISLTSKSEIRYEGVLYNINTEESSIGLRNVRSFGTEGRKKDGPQVPPSDRVYEYILFRGSDIKDLQVKSSPPVQPTPSINNDPAIIQSHYPRPTSTSMPSAVSGSLTDLSAHNQQVGLPGTNFQGGLPLYQPGGNLGTWGASPSPASATAGGLAMPMYWQGYYGPPNGIPHLHQQSMLRPPPGLSMPPSMQQPLQYPNFNASVPTGAQNLPVSNVPASNLQEVSSPLISTSTSSLNLLPTSMPPSALPSTLPPVPSAALASETLPSLMPNKAPNSALPVVRPSGSLPSQSILTTSGPELNAIMPPSSNKANPVTFSTLPYQGSSQPMSSIVGMSNSIRAETPTPVLITPGQLLQSGSTSTSALSQSVQAAHKDVEVVQVSSSSPSETPVPAVIECQPPILPLPPPQRASQKPNGAPFQNRHGYRGREPGRGTVSSRQVTQFTEDFDFIAMNEKFKKDEVWGHLGKSNQSSSIDIGDGRITDENDLLDEADGEIPKTVAKPVYNKDDFFDSLSSNALDRDTQNGRIRFSEQMKIDTETFGDFPRYRGGRGGRGLLRGGRSRGSYYGRGYGYVGRGRGRAMPSRTS
ncbi:LOW QUALITY PROTEIN: protein decapping 5-like [Tripterygium wilfordii]|uniref:LOW QUALITY PROTEIN: protein decapping 5-like n=1 Tax=Tripterygium wilfordii TaxID=458696 RepID=UPI0018F81490|nr:LOW QUALITY PROTEIN: protein decapping 5-like [Tripterygium wilfordii]